MPDPSLTLISHPLCPFVQRAAIVLLEKNVPFERINVDLSAKPDWFLALSPTGKVPLLKVHQTDEEDAILFESVVICENLEETQGGAAMYPDNALLRAAARVDRIRHADPGRWLAIPQRHRSGDRGRQTSRVPRPAPEAGGRG
ncbi:glutathione S-transferase domain-containing protein (plasmid) [Rhizobium sp. NXC24]|nr:glutathione S-transferase domain-containing protein [Rhizobium sp. NXC24]